MFRNSEFVGRRIALDDALVGLAMLPEPKDAKRKLDLAWSAVEPSMNAYDLALEHRLQPLLHTRYRCFKCSRLHFVNRCCGTRLSFERFSHLLNCMLRTGHFQGSSIVKQSRIVPPEWSILSGKGVAEVFYANLDREQDEPISLDEFKEQAIHEAEKGKLKIWYLLPRRKKKSTRSKTDSAVVTSEIQEGLQDTEKSEEKHI